MSTVTAPASAREALKMVRAGMGFLAVADATEMPGAVQAECLLALEEVDAVETAARASILGAFHAGAGIPRTASTARRRVPAHTSRDEHPRPDTALWDAPVNAGPEGISVAELEAICRMGRSWVYRRLHAHAPAGRAVQVRRGYWRAAQPTDSSASGDAQ